MATHINRPRPQGPIARRLLQSALAALAILFFVPGLLLAQTTGTLTGVVKDTSGAIVPGAKITLVNRSDKSVRSTVSSGDAFFSFAAVQPGTYDLNVILAGFEAYKITGIEMHPGDSKTIATIALQIGRVEETVTVSSRVAGVDLNSPEKSYLITDEDIKRLSTVGRDVSELIRTLPGFAVNSAGLNNDSTNNGSQVAGFSGSSVGSFSANGAAPGTGATQVVSDGANVTDPADESSSIGNVNMEMVAEVKVQTSNFGADSAKGPVVLNAVTKSGGSNYHGSVYGYVRNSALNSNDWIDNYFNNPRAGTYNYFPGANIGGPVKLPFSNFNHSKKLTFFTAGEVYDQRNLYGNTATLSFIPSARMLSGDLSTDSLERAVNLQTGASAALCPTKYNCFGLNNYGALYSPDGVSEDVQGNVFVNGQLPRSDFSPNVSAYTKFFPKINRLPRSQGNVPDCTVASNIFNAANNTSLLQPGQLCSDSINYDTNLFAQHDGFQYHARVDENFSDASKLYLTYDYEQVSDQLPVTGTLYGYAGSDIIPSPDGALSHAKSQRLSLNQTHTFGPTLTNEAQLGAVYFFSPVQLQSTTQLTDEKTGFVGPRFYNNGADQLPEIIDYQNGVPDFGMGYFLPKEGAYKRKYSINVSDNVTKQLQKHSIKAGVYVEQSANNEFIYNYNNPQGQMNFNSYSTCNVESTNPTSNGTLSDSGNIVENFLNGCMGGFSQVNKFKSGDLKYRTVDFFVTDEWKATKKLTLTYGIRFDHLGPWVDLHGQGLAVWQPEKIQPNVVYKLDPGDPTTWPGIAWKGGKGVTADPSLPLSGSPGRMLFYSPRAGLAYDLYGNGRTTFRGGWGAYRYHDSYYSYAGPLLTSLGVTTYSLPPNTSCTLDQVGNAGRINSGLAPLVIGPGPFTNPAGQVCGGTSATVTNAFSISAADAHDSQQPVTYNYNFSVDQTLPGNSLIEISYIGNQTKHAFTGGAGIGGGPDTSNQNAILPGGLYKPNPNTSSPSFGVVSDVNTLGYSGLTTVQDWRPYPNYTAIIVKNHIAFSNYNAIQLSYNKQRGALTYNLNYTWAKALGVRGDGQTGAIGDSFDLRHDYGLLPFNRKQALNITFSYQEGVKFHGNRIVGGFLNQWEVSSITSLQSGPDVAAFNANFGLYGSYAYRPAGTQVPIQVQFNSNSQLGTPDITVQPVITCNPKYNLPKTVNGAKSYINPACFALPQSGQNGTFSLPDIHGPKYFNSDATLLKNVRIKEGQSLQFRFAGFNYLNHPNYQLYGGPAAGLGIGFGQILALDAAKAPIYPTSDAAARSALIQTSNNFGSTPYKSSLRIIELGFKYTF